MASTAISDVVVPDMWLGYGSVNDPEKSLLVTSGLVTRTPEIAAMAAAADPTPSMPFWKDLDVSIEPNYSTDSPSDIAVPDKVTAGVMSSRKAYLNKGYSAADLVGDLAGSDPMQRIRDRVGTWWTRQMKRRIMAIMAGIYNANVAQNGGDMVVNIAVESIAAQTPATHFTRRAFTKAVFTMGDMFEEIKFIMVHSAVLQDMANNDDIVYIQPSQGDLNMPHFMGKMVLTDDSMPKTAGTTDGFKYLCYLFGEGAIGFGSANPKNPIAIQRFENQGNGGGVEQLWLRKTWLLHPLGYTFTNNTVTGQSATNANLAIAANWSRVLQRKLVPIAFLQVNA